MIFRLFAVAAVAATPFVASAALAQAAAGPKPLTRAMFTAEMDEEFTAVDVNKDGKMTKAEIESWQAKAAAAEASARNKSTFARLDTDKNGQLSAAEFAAIGPKPATPNAQPILARLDVNKDGSVTKEEHLGQTSARFDSLDTNKDGQVTEAEAKAGAKR